MTRLLDGILELSLLERGAARGAGADRPRAGAGQGHRPVRRPRRRGRRAPHPNGAAAGRPA